MMQTIRKIEDIEAMRIAYRDWQRAKDLAEHVRDLLDPSKEGWAKDEEGRRTYHIRLRAIIGMVEDNFISNDRLDRLMCGCLEQLHADFRQEIVARRERAISLGVDIP